MANNTDGFTFGPYHTAASARIHLSMFQSMAFPGRDSQNWGIVWSEQGRTCVLRSPTYDKDGDALALAYEWTGPAGPKAKSNNAPHAPKRPVQSVLQEFFASTEQSLQATADTYVVNPVITGVNAVHNAIVDHPIAFDSVNTVLDAYGMATGFVGGATAIGVGSATSATGVAAPLGVAEIAAGTTGIAAGVASLALFRADGEHLYLELFANEAAVKKWENSHTYLNTERVAPIVALIDPAREGTQALKAMRDLPLVKIEAASAARLATDMAADATNASDAAARINTLANNAQKTLDSESNALARIKQVQSVRQADATTASARAVAAAADLARLQKKASALEKEVKGYFSLQVHFMDATVTRDTVLNSWALGNYGFNNPFSKKFGEHIGTDPAAASLQALVPNHRSGPQMLNFLHHIYVAVVAVGGGARKTH